VLGKYLAVPAIFWCSRKMEKLNLAERISELKDNAFNSLEKIVRPIGNAILKIAAYPIDLAIMAYLKKNNEGDYCQKIERNSGKYCEISKKFIANKEFVKYFCQNGEPDKSRKRSKGLFNSYIGCKKII